MIFLRRGQVVTQKAAAVSRFLQLSSLIHHLVLPLLTTFSGPECCCGLHAHLPGATLASLQCVLCSMADSSDLSPPSYPCTTSGCFLLLPWSEPLTQPFSGISLSGFLKLPLRRSPLHMLFLLPGIPFPVAFVFELSCVCPVPELVSIPIF